MYWSESRVQRPAAWLMQHFLLTSLSGAWAFASLFPLTERRERGRMSAKYFASDV